MVHIKTFFVALFLIGTWQSFGQTKLIFHKSHSGSLETFENALEDDFFDLKLANFGLPDRDEHYLDTVIYLSDQRLVLVRSIYLSSFYTENQESKTELIQRIQDTVHIEDRYPYYAEEILGINGLTDWKAFIKNGKLGWFENLREVTGFEDIVFLGFEKENISKEKPSNPPKNQETEEKVSPKKNRELRPGSKEQEHTVIVPTKQPQTPSPFFQFLFYSLLALVVLLALVAGLLAKQFTKLKQGI